MVAENTSSLGEQGTRIYHPILPVLTHLLSRPASLDDGLGIPVRRDRSGWEPGRHAANHGPLLRAGPKSDQLTWHRALAGLGLVQVVAGAGTAQGVELEGWHGLGVNTHTSGQEVWVLHGYGLV